MARLNLDQASQFPDSNGAAQFVSLKNDKDTFTGRFAYNTLNDVVIHLVHEVKGEDGRMKNVGCLRSSYDQPTSVCPLCEANNIAKKTIYFNIAEINEDGSTGDMKLWQRSEAYFRRNVMPIFQMIEQTKASICSVPISIIRNGVQNDPKTTYTLFPQQADGYLLEDLPLDVDVEEAGIVKELSFEEVKQVVALGYLPNPKDNNIQPAQGVQRRGAGTPITQFAGPTHHTPTTVVNEPEPFGTPPVTPPVAPPANTSRRTVMGNSRNGNQ